MRIRYAILLLLGGAQIVVSLLFRPFVEPNKESYDKAVKDIEQAQDLDFIRVRAKGAMGQLYVRNRAAHDFWIYTACIGSVTFAVLIVLLTVELRASAMKKGG